MSYNLILDSKFENNSHWKFINCEYSNGYLLSNKKVFGIEQELILPKSCKLYFRINYMVDNISVNNVKIGIQYGKRLECNEKIPKLRKTEYISMIHTSSEGKIKLHLIFESNSDINKIYVDKPVLVDLNPLNKSTWLKWLLDKTICYRNGYKYLNLLGYCELKNKVEEFTSFKNGKTGIIFHDLESKQVKINAKISDNHFYLLKMDFKEVNQLGNIYFKYGALKSTRVDNQLFLLFRGKEDKEITLNIEPNDVLPYQINLRHLMIIDITKMNLIKEDIFYLPFI